MKKYEQLGGNFLGSIVSGSLAEGLTMRVAHTNVLSLLKTGKFVSIRSTQGTFFCLVADLALAVSDPEILLFPPGPDEDILREVISQRSIYATATLRPLMMVDTTQSLGTVKTVPAHFSPVYEATAHDVQLVFGNADHPSGRYFVIGTPIDMRAPVCIDLERITERSNGIFGKTGTGKTFITRLVLAGLIKQKKAAVVIFDMHSEYGFQARQEGGSSFFVKGLKSLFPHKVAIFSLDPQATRRRGCTPDVEILIPYSLLNVEDIMSLQEELNLHPTAVEAAYLIHARYKNEWLSALFTHGSNAKEFAQSLGAHAESIAALYRKLKRLERLPFLLAEEPKNSPATSVIDRMMEYIARGVSIVVEFGNYSSTICYLLVANILTRRIHSEYVERTEQFLASQAKEQEPIKLMICIEEAHKFLNPSAARQTIFGIIAREMRKYYVSLLIVDQRPSGIDPEILSQIGTKIIAQLNDEKDIQAVLTGISNASAMRTILGGLDSKKQLLVIGYAVAMPVVVQAREYNQDFYQDMASEISLQAIDTTIKEIFG